MPAQLVRPQVIEGRRSALIGDSTLAVPVSHLGLTIFFVAVVAALVTFLSLGTYARRERVPGFLISTAGVAKVMPSRRGIISAVTVAEGQMVRQGDPLIAVNSDQTTDFGQNTDRGKLTALRDQEMHLKEQIAARQRATSVSEAQLRDAIANLGAELDALQNARQTQRERTRIALEEMSAIEQPVTKGFVSKLELKRREDNYLAQQQSEQTLARDIAGKRDELEKQQHALQLLPLDAAGDISRLEAAVSELNTHLLDVDANRAYLLTAPVTGRVSMLQAWVGKTAEPNVPELAIVPTGASLKAELLVPARSIGFVAAGQKVRIGYATFPYQQFGLADGRIEAVSYTLLKPSEVVGPVTTNEDSYRVTVTLTRQTLNAYGKEIALQPDMELTATILFEDRTLLAWLLDPLFAAMRGAR